MQAIGSTEVSTGLTPQARELIKTILDAATALKRLLPDEELEHGFEFHWGHSNSPQVGEMPEFKPKTRAKSGDIINQSLEDELAIHVQSGLFTKAITAKSAEDEFTFGYFQVMAT